MTLDQQAAQLRAQISSTISALLVSRCTDFALEANAADRADLAVKLLLPLSKVASANARVWQMLGLSCRQAQDSAGALRAFARAAALAPRDDRIAKGHATTAMEAGVPSAMLFKTALDLAPNDPELLLSTVASLNADGYADVAAPLLARAVAANPAWIRGHEALATLRLTMDADDNFARSFAEAASQLPTDVALVLAWQRTLAQAGQWDAAREIVEQAHSRIGALSEFDAAAANIATETGDDKLADTLFQQVQQLDDAGTRIAHVRHCLRTGRLEQAESIAQDALTRHLPSSFWPYLSLIWRLTGNRKAEWLDGAPPMVTVTDLPFSTIELAHVADTLRRLHITRRHPADQSMRGGTQTEGLLFARIDPVLQAVRAQIIMAVRTYVDKLPPCDRAHPLLGTARGNLIFAGSWSVRLGSKGFHVCHTHPLGWISSALYIALPDEETLGQAPAGWLELGAPPKDLRVQLPSYMLIEPKPGRLVLFPSTMWHGTVPFNDGERLTIAFDVAAPTR